MQKDLNTMCVFRKQENILLQRKKKTHLNTMETERHPKIYRLSKINWHSSEDGQGVTTGLSLVQQQQQ